MNANPIQIDPTIQYPAQWTPMEYDCKCGTKCRVDVEFITGPFSAQAYQHTCGKDEEHQMPGPIIASWEERDGAWILIGKYR
jgi:hypothetical protein